MNRRPTRKRIQEYILAGVLSLAVLWVLWLVWGIARKEEIARHAVKGTQAELQTLKEREAILQGNIAELETERGREATLRETRGVAKPGEEVIIVVPPKEASTTPKLPWWKKAVNWIGFW